MTTHVITYSFGADNDLFCQAQNKGLRYYTGKEDIRMLEFYFFKAVSMFLCERVY